MHDESLYIQLENNPQLEVEVLISRNWVKEVILCLPPKNSKVPRFSHHLNDWLDDPHFSWVAHCRPHLACIIQEQHYLKGRYESNMGLVIWSNNYIVNSIYFITRTQQNSIRI